MANYSDTTIKLTGARAKEALEYLKTFVNCECGSWLLVEELAPDNSISSNSGFSDMEIYNIEENENSFEISGSGRWCSPYNFFQDLAEKFELSGHYLDREGGCDFTHLIEWENGKQLSDVEEAYFSQLAFDWCDIHSLIEDRSFISEEVDWEDEYSYEIELFAKNGISIQDLKNHWGVVA